MTAPVVDVIVAVHNGMRPIERAVASALRNRIRVRVSVVAHNVDAETVRKRLGDLVEDDRVRMLELADGVRSPANAFNHGLDAATAEYVSIMGSDDSLEAHALDAWVALAQRTSAGVVIAPIVRDSGHGVPTPRIRRSRSGAALDADRDRLFERAAPLGLLRCSAIGGRRFTSGLPRGEDQVFGLELWATARVVFDPDLPAYREHGDQRDRITHEFGPLADDFRFLPEYCDLLATLRLPLRRAAAAKLVRVHLVPAARVRARGGGLSDADVVVARRILEQLMGLAPGMRSLLPLSVRPDLDAMAAGSGSALVAASRRRTTLLAELLPIDARGLLHRHGPARTMWAGRGVARRVTRAYAARAIPSGHSGGDA